jgi:ABC-type Fe3+/spermidine/putrescine transport system ATPase subunit
MLSSGRSEKSEQSVAADDSPPAIRLRGLTKTYRNASAPAIDGLTLDIHDGEIVTLLGPSGCGKSTTLRIVAGLETADEGQILFGPRVMVDTERGVSLAPDKRHVGMVFQSYAIWPHMTVAQNIAFPLRAQHFPRHEYKDRIRYALSLVGMDGYQDRPAPLLSGGQQQRVALARALVTEPRVLLLDEPFSNLDAKLREQMRIEVKLLQERLKIATLFVTHDQSEALGLSDRIVLIDRGRVQQLGHGRELYERPVNEFVRDFVGKTLLFRGRIVSMDDAGRAGIAIDGTDDAVIYGRLPVGVPTTLGKRVRLAVRPEDLDVEPASQQPVPAGALSGSVEAALFVGERVEYQIKVAEQERIVAYGDRHGAAPTGSVVWLKPRYKGHSVWLDEG